MRTNVTCKKESAKGSHLVGAMCLLLLLLQGAATRAADADSDFMEDQWEVQYGLDPDDADDALLDLDNDGFVNLCEYLHGCDPSDAAQRPAENVTIGVPTAVGTIQAAIDMSINGDTVLVQPGTYEEGLNVSDREIHITGTAPDDPDTVAATIIDPGYSYYDIVTFISSQKVKSVLEGVTLTGGQRGIYCHGRAAPVITHCIIEGNSAAGLYINGNADAEVTVSHCRIIGNANDGIVCLRSRLSLHHTVVAQNGNEWSTGVYLYDGDGGYSRIHNCTVVGHGARGIRTVNMSENLPDIVNCIIWDNRDDLVDCFATFSCIQDGDTGQGNCLEDPRFIDVDANDFRISSGSLCIDGGVPWSDYHAEPAPNGNRINMGAYGNTVWATASTDADSDGISDNWERHYWPGDDPSLHHPTDDPEADGFDNRTEYLYGYDPTVATGETSGVVYALVTPEEFNPTLQETLTIRYWLNAQAQVAIGMSADMDPNDIRQTLSQAGLSGENTLQWNGCDPHGDIVEKGRYCAVVDANIGGILSQAQSNASQLKYEHRIRELRCQPGRFYPLHNDITRIKYDASPDADMAVEIYDPMGTLFCTYPIKAADANEILWQGTDRALGDPTGRYPALPGTYRIEARFQGMRENVRTTVEVYR